MIHIKFNLIFVDRNPIHCWCTTNIYLCITAINYSHVDYKFSFENWKSGIYLFRKQSNKNKRKHIHTEIHIANSHAIDAIHTILRKEKENYPKIKYEQFCGFTFRYSNKLNIQFTELVWFWTVGTNQLHSRPYYIRHIRMGGGGESIISHNFRSILLGWEKPTESIQSSPTV